MKRETRHLTSPIEVRKEGNEDSRRIEGYALVFNSRSQDLNGFVETIEPGALEGVIERSDVLALLNHEMARGVLARSRNGEGSLELNVDEKGLRYSFEAPNTALGDELLEGVKRGDISASSFAFTVEEDQWDKEEDGRYLRTIKRFGELFDVSPVYHPAYLETSVDTRGLDALKRAEEEDEKKKEECSESEEEEEPRNDNPQEEEDERSDDSEPDDDKEEKEEDEEKEPSEDDKRNNNNNINQINLRKMEKKQFSLLGAIRSIVDQKPLDEATQKIMDEGRRAIESAGESSNGQIVLPLESRTEKRYESEPAGIIASQNTEAETYGGEAVPTELFDLLGPLQDRMILTQLGARMLNLSGNIEIPIYEGAQCTWESEKGKAKDGSGKFKKVKLSPKRLTAYLPVSKQFLIQSSPTAEALIRQNLVDCIAQKLQQTIFGSGKGSETEPAGLFNGVTADSAAFTFEDAVKMEEKLETANVYGEKKYALSPSAKAILRTTKVDEGSGLMVMANNEVAGVPALSTSSVVSKGLILGDWSQFYLASFGALDITVDPLTLADQAQIRLVVNAWFDYATVRPEAFVKRILQ